MGRVAIGVDIGGTNIRAARVSPDGRMDGLRKVRTDAILAPMMLGRGERSVPSGAAPSSTPEAVA